MPDKPVHVELSPKMVNGAVTSDEVLRDRYGIPEDIGPQVQKTTAPTSQKYDPKPFGAPR